MKTELFLYILIACFVVIGFVGLILYTQDKKPKLNPIGKYVARSALYVIMIILIMLHNRGDDAYSLSSEQRFWQKNQLPQIDSTMIYEYSSKSMRNYISYSKDSILHYAKLIEKDVFDIYSVTDVFINRKENIELQSKFIKQNFLRDSARFFTMGKWIDNTNSIKDTIPKAQFDSIIATWGLSENLYQIFEIHRN